MISYIIPTRDRHTELLLTLRAIERLGAHEPHGAEVIIADNASQQPAWWRAPTMLESGVPVRILNIGQNLGAAARNHAALAAKGDWLVMLDDDSHPLDAGLIDALYQAPAEVAAVGAEIYLPAAPLDDDPLARALRPSVMATSDLRPGWHEQGGLPEVFIGCGVALRREPFVKLGGYDPTFDYYAEEYDLAARLIVNGWRIGFDPRFAVLHRKVLAGRNMDRILRRLVRNNAWVAQRYAPKGQRAAAVREAIGRYGRIALKENALSGLGKGLAELATTLTRQPRCEMSQAEWDRFTGFSHALDALSAANAQRSLGRVALVNPGKNAAAVRRAVQAVGSPIVADEKSADTLVIATMSPGPMLDGLAVTRYQNPTARVVAPWLTAQRMGEQSGTANDPGRAAA